VLGKGPGPVVPLQEHIWTAMSLMVNQPTRHAIIKLPKKHTKFVETNFVKEAFAGEEQIKRFKDKCYQESDFANKKPLIEAEIENRHYLLLTEAFEPKDEPENDDYLE
jgi:hypothetical protein